MNWRELFLDRDTVLRDIEDLKFTCAHEGLKIVFGLFFILFSSYALFSLVGVSPKTDAEWRVFALFFSLLFSLLMFGLSLLITDSYGNDFWCSCPPPTTGNLTNIYENCSYPITTIVNNYNITVIENYSGSKNPSVSIEELKYLIGSHK
jgi:hypothetical protein